MIYKNVEVDEMKKDLEHQLAVLRDAQHVINYRFFEALLSCNASAAKKALAHIAAHAADLDQADAHELQIAQSLGRTAKLLSEAVALRESAAEVRAVVKRAKSDR
jgi:hypothetical protein